MHRIFFFLVLSLAALRLEAATMARVVRVAGSDSLVVVRDGSEVTIRLAGITVTDARRATEVLRWSTHNAWVMLEPQAGDTWFVYRTPDALFLNRELVERGCARATAPGIEATLNAAVTYLGEINPPGITTPQPRTGRDTSRRSPAKPSPPARSRRRPPTKPSAPGRR